MDALELVRVNLLSPMVLAIDAWVGELAGLSLGGTTIVTTMVASTVAGEILAVLARDCFERFAVLADLDDVQVVRGETYV